MRLERNETVEDLEIVNFVMYLNYVLGLTGLIFQGQSQRHYLANRPNVSSVNQMKAPCHITTDI